MKTQAPSRWRPALRPPKRRRSRPELDVADIQGNVIRGYTHAVAAYVFARVDDAESGRHWLTRLADQVTDARPWGDERPETTLNAALTASGLAAVGVREDVLATFPEDFRQGMAARAELLGDTGPSAPDQWEQPLGTGEAHVFLTLHAENDEALVGRVASIRGELGELGGIELVYEQHAMHPLGGRDHFGFLDGVSQPVIDGGGVEPRPGDGVFDKRGNWRAMRAGDFILGYIDEDGVLPEAPRPRSATTARS